MRFSRLHIPAYGPFTNFELALPKRASDFHLIYGPNEAGKSSLLRALRALLFGIHSQTSDGFLHAYNSMRIAADLELPDGSLRTFQRRKGNKNTLLDANDQPISESELTACLGGVDADYFDSMFGLNGEGLRIGADALLRGEGRLGEALFSASMGGTPVDLVIRDLEAEAAEIFSGRAQKRLRQALHSHTVHLGRKKDVLVKPEDWEETERLLGEVIKRLSTLQSQRQELSNRQSWLERCRDALVMVGKLRDHEAQLVALPRIDGLPESFAKELLAARADKLAKEGEVRRLTGELERIGEQMATFTPNQTLLEKAAAIHQIHANLGAYTSDKIALARKQGEASTAKENIGRMCLNLGITEAFENLEPLRITQLQFAEAEDQAALLKTEVENVEKAEARLEELARNTKKREAAKTEIDEARLAKLKALRDQATQIQDKAESLPERRRELGQLERSLVELHRELPGAPADHQQTSELPVPPHATLERFRFRWEESEGDLRRANEGIRQLRQQVGDQKAEIEGLMRLKDIPDLQKLAEAREYRDRGWRLVLEDWIGTGAKEELEPGKLLQEAYPAAVAGADEVADRLRSEASAVAQITEKRLHLGRLEQRLTEDEAALTHLQQQSEALRQEWEKAWEACAFIPRSPAEMLAWRNVWQDFRRQWNEHAAKKAGLEEDAGLVDSLIAAMAESLSSIESGFAPLRQQIVEELEVIEAAKVEGLAAQKIASQEKAEIEDIEQKLGMLKSAREAAQERWIKLAASLRVPAELSSIRALDLLKGRREVFREFDRHSGLASECLLLQASMDEFEQNVKATATSSGFAEDGIEVLAQTLWNDLQTSQQSQRSLDTLREAEADKNRHLQQAQEELDGIEKEFTQRCLKGSLDDAAGVDAFVATFEDVQQHQQKAAGLRESLAGLARGEAVNDFTERVSKEDANGIEGELARLEQELLDLDRQQEESRNEKQVITAKKTLLEKAGDEAARSDQLAQFEEGRMLADARRFIELQTALTLLKGQINHFRQQNQGPFMAKASHWLAQLTGGGFEGIITSFANGDEPTIAGRRRGDMANDEVAVTGMSEGTRDQLYLALRLAGLQLHLEDHVPMPLILDDLLVHFDDERASHALRALAEISGQCQILLFTHHQHVLELARNTLGADAFTEHALRSS
jgi:uncharacterized protein YhaN